MKFTKQQAYNVLNDALAKIQTTRESHMILSEALNTLMRQEIQEPQKPKAVEPLPEKQEAKAK